MIPVYHVEVSGFYGTVQNEWITDRADTPRINIGEEAEGFCWHGASDVSRDHAIELAKESHHAWCGVSGCPAGSK